MGEGSSETGVKQKLMRTITGCGCEGGVFLTLSLTMIGCV